MEVKKLEDKKLDTHFFQSRLKVHVHCFCPLFLSLRNHRHHNHTRNAGPGLARGIYGSRYLGDSPDATGLIHQPVAPGFRRITRDGGYSRTIFVPPSSTTASCPGPTTLLLVCGEK